MYMTERHIHDTRPVEVPSVAADVARLALALFAVAALGMTTLVWLS